MATSTARLGLDEPQSTDNISGFPADDVQALGTLDNAVIVTQGALASRPAAGSVPNGLAGNEYFATDTGQWFKSDGSNWDSMVIVTSTSYGRATLSAPQSITTPNVYETVVLNSLTFGSWNTSTGAFSVPAAGVYLMSADLYVVSYGGGVASNADAAFAHNGTTSGMASTGFTSTYGGPGSFTDTISCNVGDTLGLYVSQDGTGTHDGITVGFAVMTATKVG